MSPSPFRPRIVQLNLERRIRFSLQGPELRYLMISVKPEFAITGKVNVYALTAAMVQFAFARTCCIGLRPTLHAS
jgi:hypothetical protein